MPRPKFQEWPAQHDSLSAEKVIEMYRDGFIGAMKSTPEQKQEFKSLCTSINGTADSTVIAKANGWYGSGAGKLSIPFVFIDKHFPGSLPGPGQERGDCVSWGTKNAILLTLACEIESGKPDEVTGILEGVPEVPADGIRDGVLSTEYLYWFRGYNGDGWQCPIAAKVAITYGVLLKKPYPELDIDLTNYSGRLAGKYGSRKPPEEIQAEGKKHLVRTSTTLRSFEEIRDYLNNGYGVSSCGGEGFSNKRDENGVSRRQGSWAHAMAYIGADDRPETHDKYDGPLVLVQNSWGKWNNGPRQILGTTIDIPEGSFWARWKDVSRREAIALSSVNGWPGRSIPFW